MPDTKLSLAHILAPTNLEEFSEEYWEKKPLHISRADESHYKDLITLDRVDSLVSQGHDKGLSISLSNLDENGQAQVQEFGGSRAIDHDSLYSSFADGATVRIRDMERHLDLGQQLTADLEKWANAPVHINMYLTPRNAKGFNTHQDGHDVFILQTAGRKHWRVYDKPVDLPSDRVVSGRQDLFDDQPLNRTVPTEHVPDNLEKQLDVTLEPGDCLYIPRGFYHDARTKDALSMHLTVGVYVVTWHDAVVKSLASLFEDFPLLREALPPGFAVGDADASELREMSERVLGKIREHLSPGRVEDAIDEIGEKFVESRRSAFRGYLQGIDRMQKGIANDERFTVRPEVAYRILRGNDEKIHLTYNGRKVRLPNVAEPIVQYMSENETFTVQELPTELSDDQKLRIVQHLIQHGFLTFK